MCGRMVMLAWLAVVLACVGADIISYENDLLLPQRPIYLMLPKFGPGDVPAGPPGDGRSFVDMSPVSIELDCDAHPHYADCTKTVVEVLVFKAPPGMWSLVPARIQPSPSPSPSPSPYPSPIALATPHPR
jgi:hypothetical protein